MDLNLFNAGVFMLNAFLPFMIHDFFPHLNSEELVSCMLHAVREEKGHNVCGLNQEREVRVKLVMIPDTAFKLWTEDCLCSNSAAIF